MQKAIEIAAKLYQARDACRGLPSWDDTIPQLKDLINKRSERNGTDTLKTLHEMLELVKDDPITMMWLMAAAVEIVEPSDNGIVPTERRN